MKIKKYTNQLYVKEYSNCIDCYYYRSLKRKSITRYISYKTYGIRIFINKIK